MLLFVVIMWGCAFLMLGIGIANLRSKKPVGFYSGVKPPLPEELSDVGAWNKKHGMMWVIYGILIFLSVPVAYVMGDTPLILIPVCGSVVFPLCWMIPYHHHLCRLYLINYAPKGRLR